MSDQSTNGKTVGDLAQEILNRIITDADFRQQIAKNPEETLAQAGYTAGDDVSGYIFNALGPGGGGGGKGLGSGSGGGGRDLGPGGGGGHALGPGGGGKALRPPRIGKPGSTLRPGPGPKDE